MALVRENDALIPSKVFGQFNCVCIHKTTCYMYTHSRFSTNAQKEKSDKNLIKNGRSLWIDLSPIAF